MIKQFRLCKNCIHYRNVDGLRDKALCAHQEFRSLVDGEIIMRCEMARFDLLCGREAKLFSPKPPEGAEPDFEVIEDDANQVP